MSARRPSLQRLLKQCQKLLALGSWDISIRYCTKEELPTDADGLCLPNYEHRVADILILDPALRDPSDDMRPYSVRETVIHECLHCMVRDADTEREEQTINALARAIDSLL